MDNVNLFSYFLAILSLTGNYFVNKKNVIGFYIWIVANVGWGFIYFILKQEGSFFLMIAYTLLSFHGIYTWQFKKIEKE